MSIMPAIQTKKILQNLSIATLGHQEKGTVNEKEKE